MLVYEIDLKTLREYKNNVSAVIAAGEYIPRSDEFIRRAFNNGRGTIKDFVRYRNDNRMFCKWFDPVKKCFI